MKEALKLALEALELNNREWKATADSGDSGYWLAEEQDFYQQTEKAITAIKEALAQTAVTESHKQEPVAVLFKDGSIVKYEDLEKGAFWWREDMKRLFDYNNKEK